MNITELSEHDIEQNCNALYWSQWSWDENWLSWQVSNFGDTTVQSRGMLIGEIIDELAALGAQVKMRNRVHLFDLNTVAEEFFREFLNILLQASFRNLNADTPNAPAIDLVDDGKRLAVQVTSKADTAKINHTLQKLSESNEDAYSRVIVLGLNPRQKSYAVDESLAAKYRFKAARDVWDLDTLAKKAMGLEFERLQALHRLVRMSAARLRVELEIPDEEGNYPTSGYDLWERRAEP
ncbi:SMEK domain-containing protein [Achromobacter xylosoxidans]|uniref:SMEK domain-containing protein n=1 Tax=Alcaligenes xylosoxydans xylosoxydans TaxID=85698 RepID=UPI00292EF5EE|nr:SMEK domain-containing protein [Achromobacter xylosoxidans]WOB74353.1 SMEK domain-containing protein [Achromobacter xylosoxidans]